MKQIVEVKSLRLEQLNNSEYAHFLKGVVDLVETATPEQINVENEVYEQLKKCVEGLTEALHQVRASSNTQKLAESDKLRSRLVVYLLSSFRLNRNSIEESISNAGEFLYLVTKNYKGIQSKPLGQKTQLIESLLVDLKKPEAATYVEALRLKKSVTELENANNEYHRLVNDRIESQLQVVSINTKEVKKQSRNLYRYITKCAYATNICAPTEQTTTFVQLLNKLIEDTKRANKRRLAGLASKSSERENAGSASAGYHPVIAL